MPIRTQEQRDLMNEAKQLAKQTKLGSLIQRATYKEQLNAFVYQCQRAGIHQVHGHRHLYAQRRYESLTGWRCPAAGGPRSRQLTPAQKAHDTRARLIVSAELGHTREQVTAVYLGR
ncbi:MAG: integrase [Gammaproteobacteria bacterium]|nr:integrase [Gammaproteobacteria bacterium]